MRTLSDIFTDSRSDEDSVREIVASCGDYRLSRFEMHSVLPCSPVSSKVINIVAAYMCETESECWYLPTQFGDIAESYADPSKVQVGVGTTINICRLQRFYRRLRQCDKIFIPLYDELLEHWYLLVMNIAEKKGELWDSKPESSSYDRRMSLVGRAIKLLQKIFANEMYRSTDVYLHFPSFNISVPQSNPTHDNNYDSGIFVIRHMQHHNNTWYTQAQFHLNDLRMRIAVEIVTHPRNTIINSNSTSSSNYSRSVGHNAMALKRRHAQHSEIGKCGANHDFQFVRQNSSNAPNGRKCRSHRLRRSRA